MKSLKIFSVLLMLCSGVFTFAQTTFYALNTDTWNSYLTWTTDQSGKMFINPNRVVPGVSSVDNVVIPAGKIVTYDLSSNINVGSLEILGELRLTGTGTINVQSLDGTGVLQINDLRHITLASGTLSDFNGVIDFATSITLSNCEYHSVTISSGLATLSGNVTINGNFTIKAGGARFANANNSLKVKGDIRVESGAAITSAGTGTTESTIDVEGDFINNGTLTFANGSKPSASQSNSNLSQRVIIKMTGSKNAIFENHGTATLFRIVCEKATASTAEITNNGTLNMMGKTAGLTNYLDLPWVPKSGIMKLGSNITINSWGANERVQTNGNYYADDEPCNNTGTMYIPEGAKLLIAGAHVTVGNEDCSSYQKYKGNVLIAGELEISSGSLILSEYSWGILFVAPIGATATESASKLTVSGGQINTPRISCWYNAPNGKSRGGVYTQTAGDVNINISPNSRYANKHSDKTFFLGENSKFVMHGGTFNISKQINNSTKGINGIWMAKDDYSPIETSVSGGTFSLTSSALNDYRIFAPEVQFCNFTIKSSAKVKMYRPDDQAFLTSDLHVLRNLTLSSSASLDCSMNGTNYDLYVGGNISIDASSSVTNVATLYLDQNTNCTYNVASTSQKWNNVSLTKTSASAKVTISNQPMQLTGALYGKLGNVSGNMSFVGTAQQTINDVCGAFAGVNLTLNNASGVKLLSDTEFNSITFSRNAIFSMGSYGLKVNTDLATSGWGTSRMFATDNNSSAHGLTVPATNGGILPIGANGYYGPVQITFPTSAGGFVTAIAVNDKYPANTIVPEFYWRIHSTVADYTNKKQATYNCRIPDNIFFIGIAKRRAYIIGEKETYENSNERYYQGDWINFTKLTNGDYLISDANIVHVVVGSSANFVSVSSGKWDGKIWNKNNGTAANASGPDITTDDIVRIKSGHTVTVTGEVMGGTKILGTIIGGHYCRAGEIQIDEGATLIIENSHVGDFDIRRFSGKGTLIYKSTTIADADYTDFCSNDTATFVYELSSSATGGKDNMLREYPNLKVTGSSFTLQTDQNSFNDITINGDFIIDASTTVQGFQCTDLTICKSLVVNSGKTFKATGNTSRLDILGNITNNGTITLSTPTFLIGGITNNGQIDATGGELFYFKGGAATGELVKVGGSATAGKTNIQNIVIAKDYATAQVQFDIPVGDSNGNCSVHLLRGALNIATSAKTMNLKDFTSNQSWQSCIDDEEYYGQKGSDITAYYDIPDGAKLQLFKGATVNVNADRLRLAGSLNIMEASTVNVGGGSKNIGYVTETSILRVGEGSTLNISQLASYTSDATLSLNLDKNATINIGSGSIYGNYGAFDIRGGKCTFGAGAVVNINNAATNASANPSLYYTPSTSSLNGSSKFNINKTGNFIINSTQPLSNVTIANGVNASLQTNPLTVNNALTLAGSLNSNGFDVTLKGNVSVTGTYEASGNTTYFKGGSQNVTSTSSLSFDNLTANVTGTLKFNNAFEVKKDFDFVTGTITLADNATILGNVNIAYQTTTNGAGAIVLNGSAKQTFFCEGSINNLIVNNTHNIASGNEQAHPIVITGTLDLQNGQFSIGGNLLELGTEAVITSTVGDFGLNRMITTNTSLPDRGIRLNLTKGTHNVFLPLGGFSKYSPVELSNVVVGTAGYITFVGTDYLYKAIESYENFAGDALKYHWSVKEMDAIKITSGSLVLRTSLTDAAGYPATNYGRAFLNLGTGLWTKTTTDCTVEGNFFKVTFPLKGTSQDLEGIYTAGVREQLPDEVLTYISVADGNWTDAIWKKYSLKTSTITDNTLYDPDVATDMNGCGIVIGSNTTVQMQSTDRLMDLCFVEIKADGVLNAGSSQNNNAGYIRGLGKLVVESGNSMLGGNYDKFFGKNCGTIEYTGNTDYNVYVYAAYANNVIFSGSGKRNMRSDVSVSALGDVTIKDNAQVVLAGKDFTLNGDLEINGGSITGTGFVTFAGSETQNIAGSVATAKITGLQMNNKYNVVSGVNIEVNQLKLTAGILSFNNDNYSITVNQAGTKYITGGSTTSYVDGWLCKKLSSGTQEPFPVGNVNRYAQTYVKPSTAGIWKVRYVNDHPAEFNEAADNEVQSVGNEYWKIQGPTATATAQVKLRWDEQSGGVVDKQTQVAYYDGIWKTITYTGYTGNSTAGSLTAASLTTYYNNGPRLYAFGVSQEKTNARWTGAISTDWDTEENWSNGTIPTMYSSIVIPNTEKQPIVETSLAVAQDVEIQSGASLSLMGSVARLEITGKIVNNGNLNLYYEYDAMPKFVFTGTLTGNKPNIYRSFVGGRLHYIGSATVEGTFASANHTITGSDRFTKYDDTNETFINNSSYVVGTNASGEVGSFSGSGYLGTAGTIGLRGSDAQMVVQTGTIQKATAVKGVKLSKNSQWSWVANPYPFAVDTKAALGNNSAITTTVYFRTYDGGYTYITYNTKTKISVGGNGSVINPFEAVCVEVPEYTKGKTLDWKMTEANSTTLKSVAVDTESSLLRLNLVGDAGGKDEVALLFSDEGQMTYFDGDSHKKDNGTTNQLAVQKEGVNLTIANYPEAERIANIEIPVVISKSSKASQLTIEASNIASFFAADDVYMVDHLTGEKTNLRENPVYNITDVDNLSDDRYALVIGNKGAIVETPTSVESVITNNIIVYANNNTIIIRTAEEAESGSVAKIYDVAGQLILQTPLTSKRTEIQMPQQGVYVVEAISGDNKATEKLLID